MGNKTKEVLLFRETVETEETNNTNSEFQLQVGFW